MLRIIILFFSVFGLSSCFIAPGMKMPTPPTSYASQIAATEIKPRFIPITVDLVRHEHLPSRYEFYDRNGAHSYRVGAYDVLNIYIWNHPEFNPPVGQAPSEQGVNGMISPTISPVGYLVNPQGEVFFPLVGYLHVGGKTVEQIRSQLTQSMRRYIRHPQIDVRVTGFRSKKIYVMGEVAKPGLLPLTDSPLSITDAINLAGGMLPDSADPSSIFVIRGNYACPDVYWLNAHSPASLILAENFHLQPHDVVFISTANISRFNRGISQVLPTIQTVWFTWAVINRK